MNLYSRFGQRLPQLPFLKYTGMPALPHVLPRVLRYSPTPLKEIRVPISLQHKEVRLPMSLQHKRVRSNINVPPAQCRRSDYQFPSSTKRSERQCPSSTICQNVIVPPAQCQSVLVPPAQGQRTDCQKSGEQPIVTEGLGKLGHFLCKTGF